MPKYKYIVTVTTDTEERATIVMNERIYFEEQYEDKDGVDFDYEIDYEDLGVLHDVKESIE